jgi:23S rRNA pseudouridine1911/1915/1917 synthase
VSQYPNLSRSYATRLIEDGKVTVNGEVVSKAGYKLRPVDKVTIDYEPSEKPSIPLINIPVLYEDRDCVVINKPAGVLTHSKGAFNPEATVATWLSSRIHGMDGERAGIVHRLDRATSGVMIAAKTPEALSWLQKQFSQRNVKKTYIAIVKGAFEQPEAIIDMPIERNPRKPQMFRVGANGKQAQTAYKVLDQNLELALVEMKPTTGRTHQLRVHLAHLKHPIVGDTLYGGPSADRLYLHAQRLEVTLPNKQRKTFEAAVPKQFESMLEA